MQTDSKHGVPDQIAAQTKKHIRLVAQLQNRQRRSRCFVGMAFGQFDRGPVHQNPGDRSHGIRTQAFIKFGKGVNVKIRNWDMVFGLGSLEQNGVRLRMLRNDVVKRLNKFLAAWHIVLKVLSQFGVDGQSAGIRSGKPPGGIVLIGNRIGCQIRKCLWFSRLLETLKLGLISNLFLARNELERVCGHDDGQND